MRDQEITIEPIVPMDHRMGGDRTIEQVQAAEMFSTFVWEQEHVDDSTGGAMRRAEAWWQRSLERRGCLRW